jgi:tetratricopeptide (TPR) repeat protein
MIAFIIAVLILVPLITAAFVIRAQTRNKLEKGLKLLEDGDCERALAIFDELSKKNPAKRSYNWYRGLCHEKLGNFEMALVEFNNAALSTTFRPPLNEVEIHRKLAHIHLNLGNDRKAESEFFFLTTIDSAGKDDRAESYYYLGIIARNRDELQKGVEHFTRTVQLKPQLPRAYLELGKLNLQLTQFDAARKALMKAVSNDPDLVEAHYYYGILLERDRSFKKAIEEFEIAMQDERYKFSSFFHLGLIYIELFDRDMAFDFFVKAL